MTGSAGSSPGASPSSVNSSNGTIRIRSNSASSSGIGRASRMDNALLEAEVVGIPGKKKGQILDKNKNDDLFLYNFPNNHPI